MPPSTLIFRHRRENLSKCSLKGLEGCADLQFLSYPLKQEVILPSSYCLLSFDGVPLTRDDRECGLIFLDATWRYVDQMVKNIPCLVSVPRRSLPVEYKTAYPRRQEDCSLPSRGLATVEALFIAYSILERKRDHLLTHYHWKEAFLLANNLIVSG